MLGTSTSIRDKKYTTSNCKIGGWGEVWHLTKDEKQQQDHDSDGKQRGNAAAAERNILLDEPEPRPVPRARRRCTSTRSKKKTTRHPNLGISLIRAALARQFCPPYFVCAVEICCAESQWRHPVCRAGAPLADLRVIQLL